MTNSYLRLLRKLANCTRFLLWGAFAAILASIAAPKALANFLNITALEVEESTYFPEDPVPMMVAITDSRDDGDIACYEVHVHLTSDANFRTDTDHMLNILVGSIAPGETIVRTWTQMMPGNLPGTFFVDAEVTTCHGSTPAMSSPTSWLASASLVQTAKITLAPETYPETDLLSVTRDGTQSNALSEDASISDDGRYVAFASESTTLLGVERDEEGEIITDDDDNPVGSVRNTYSDIYLRDNWTGDLDRISIPLGASDANGPSYLPRISADGRSIVFHSSAANLVPGISNNLFDVFFKDLESGELYRISTGINGKQGDQASQNASVSGDGRWVVFESEATNLLAGDTNSFGDIFLYDAQERRIVRRINTTDDGVQAQGGHSRFPRISADGQHIVFESRAKNLTEDPSNGVWEIYVHDRDANRNGIFDESGGTHIRRLSVGYDRSGNPLFADGHSRSADLTNDGRLVVFQSESTHMAAVGAEGAIILPGRSAEAELTWSENEEGIATIQLQSSLLAEGAIGFLSNPTDGQSFTISDGSTNVTFEFDGPVPNGVAPDNIRVIIGGNSSATRNNLVRALNNAFGGTLEAEAADDVNGSVGLRLRNLAFGAPQANEPIDVSSAQTLFAEGMSGAGAPVASLQSGDTIEIDHSHSGPVTIWFFNPGEVDPTDFDVRILGVELGRTTGETSRNLLSAFEQLGYHPFSDEYLPHVPSELLPPLMENPRNGESYVFRHGEVEETFVFVGEGAQFDPQNFRRVRIGFTPQETRGNLLRAIYFLGIQFDQLPAIFEETGDRFAFGENFNDSPAEGAVYLKTVPEAGHSITISDGSLSTRFRFDEERELTDEEEEMDFELPPFEIVGAGLVRIYIFEEIRLEDLMETLQQAISASFLNLTVSYGGNGDLGSAAILLLNNRVGEFGNVPIAISPLDEEEEPGDDDDDGGVPPEETDIVDTEWAAAFGMTGGVSAGPQAGGLLVFYPENLLHPTVTFEFTSFSGQLSSEADFAVQIGSTGAETEGNLLAAIHSSGLPWLTAEGGGEGEEPLVRLRSILSKPDGTIVFDLSTSNPDAFACLGDCPGDRNGQVQVPYQGGTLTLNDGRNPEVVFEFTFDGTVSDETHVPVLIATVGALTRDNLINAVNQAEHLDIHAEGMTIPAVDPSAPDKLVVRLINANYGAQMGVVVENLGPIAVTSIDSGGWNPRSGESFRIGDANGNFETFEFVLPGETPEAGNIGLLTVPTSDSADQRTIIRDRINAAIKGSGLDLIVTNGVENNYPAVFLESVIPGPSGNVPIQVLTPNPSFIVRGLSGGAFLGNGRDQIYLVDRDANQNGNFDEGGETAVELISITEEGLPADDISLEPAISGDGRFVAFRTLAHDLQPRTVVRSDGEVFANRAGFIWPETDEIMNFTDVSPFSDLYVRDRVEGTNRRISVNRFGEAYVARSYTENTPRSSRGAAINYDGRFIAFESDDESYNQAHRGGRGDGRIRGGGLAHTTTNRNTLDNNSFRDVFLHDRKFPTDAPIIPGTVVLSLPGIVLGGVTPEVTVGSAVDLVADVSGILPGRSATSVRFFANGNPIGFAGMPAIPGTNLFAIRWVPGVETTYRIVAVATDSNGNQLPMSDELTVVAKKAEGAVRPTAIVINPPFEDEFVPENAFPLTNRSEWPFAAAISAGPRGIDEVNFMIRSLTAVELADNFIDNSLGGILMGMAQKEPSASSQTDDLWRLNFDFAEFGPAGLPPGYYAVWAVARDSSGNLGSSGAIPIVVSTAIFNRPSVRLTVDRRETTREEFNRFRVQVDTRQGQVNSGGEVYLFANSILPDFGEDNNPQETRPFVWEGAALYTGVWNYFAVARDTAGNTSISNVVRVTVHPFENIVGNPADPLQSAAFVFEVYQNLLLRSEAPSTGLARSFIHALETGAKTRGEVIEDLMKQRDFETIRLVIAAYLTVLRDPPTYGQLIDGVALLRGSGDDDDDEPDDSDDDNGGFNPGVPPRLLLLISTILDSDDFWYKYIRTGKVGFDEVGSLDMEDLLEVVHHKTRTFSKKQADLGQMLLQGRVGYLANLTVFRMQENSSDLAAVDRIALVLLLLKRDTSLAEVGSLPTNTVDAANYIVTHSGFIALHDGPESFLSIRGLSVTGNPSLLGVWDEESKMYVNESTWFGLLNDSNFNHSTETGWIKHKEHGWMFIAPNSVTEAGAWLWDDIKRDWMWTNASEYPFFYSDNGKEWIYYEKGGRPASRWFYSYKNGRGWFNVTN